MKIVQTKSVIQARSVIINYEKIKELNFGLKPSLDEVAKKANVSLKKTKAILNEYFTGKLDRSGFPYDKTLF